MVKKWFFWKNCSKIKKGFKNWVLNMCHMPPKRIFKKSQNFEFFQKRGVKGVKKWFFWKNISKIEKGFKNWVLNMCHMPPKRIFKKSQNFEVFFQKRGVKGVKKCFFWKNISKKLFFWKNISKIEKGYKNWILNMCHMSQKKIFKKSDFLRTYNTHCCPADV